MTGRRSKFIEQLLFEYRCALEVNQLESFACWPVKPTTRKVAGPANTGAFKGTDSRNLLDRCSDRTISIGNCLKLGGKDVATKVAFWEP